MSWGRGQSHYHQTARWAGFGARALLSCTGAAADWTWAWPADTTHEHSDYATPGRGWRWWWWWWSPQSGEVSPPVVASLLLLHEIHTMNPTRTLFHMEMERCQGWPVMSCDTAGGRKGHGRVERFSGIGQICVSEWFNLTKRKWGQARGESAPALVV